MKSLVLIITSTSFCVIAMDCQKAIVIKRTNDPMQISQIRTIKEQALFSAVEHDDCEMAQQLLQHGELNLAMINKDKKCPLHIAIENASVKMVKLLLDHGAPVNNKSLGYMLDKMYRDPAALHKIHRDANRLFFKKQRDIWEEVDYEVKNNLGKKKEIRQLLAIYNAHSVDIGKKLMPLIINPFLRACALGEYHDIQRLLISNLSDLNKTGEEGMTGLMWAAARGHEKCVKMLVAYGAHINVRNKYKKTAYDLAEKNGRNALIWYDKEYAQRFNVILKVLRPDQKKSLPILKRRNSETCHSLHRTFPVLINGVEQVYGHSSRQ